jgi:high affinity sulfate transporter 1
MALEKIKHLIPIITWLPQYNPKNIRYDLIAGIAVAGLVIPESMGIAGVAGVEPQHGLYAVLIALFVYSILGSGKRSAVSTPSAMALLTATAVTSLALTAYEDILTAVVSITFLTGLILLLMAILRLGVLADFISYPVMKGFLFGLALTIIIGQIPKLLGITKGTGNFFAQLWYTLTQLGQTNLLVLALSIVAIAVMFTLESRFKKIPAVLILFITGIIAAYFLGFESKGVQLVGYIPPGLPVFMIPAIDPDVIFTVFPICIGIAFVCFSETISKGEEVSEAHNEEVNPDQELLAVASANIGSSLAQGIGSGVSMSASHEGDNSGSKSQMALIVAGVVVLATLLFLTGVFYYLPEFILGVIVIFAVKGALKARLMINYYHTQRIDFYFAMVALFGVLIFEVLIGLVLAIFFSIGLVIWKISNEKGSLLGKTPEGQFKDIQLDHQAKEVDGVKILRLNMGLFYASAPVIKKRLLNLIKGDPKPKLLIVDMETHTGILDISSVHALAKVVEEAKLSGVKLVFVNVHTRAMTDMEKQGLVDLIGTGHFKDTIADALLFKD